MPISSISVCYVAVPSSLFTYCSPNFHFKCLQSVDFVFLCNGELCGAISVRRVCIEWCYFCATFVSAWVASCFCRQLCSYCRRRHKLFSAQSNLLTQPRLRLLTTLDTRNFACTFEPLTLPCHTHSVCTAIYRYTRRVTMKWPNTNITISV